ncbi:DUF2007 domain-containing protein [Cognatiluteimonas telluris]|jgi:hypothetical protein|uniref:DUF2007 domain-containing protein n=1 Tax=Cognatiluteimonas telluris TaxID=1104775 RepID=UPI00140B2A4C|nr:DUF2007 domain-containing protein [Lysobacter telluris]
MRQVFSSPRMENVERVAALLNQAGIATRVTHARSYKGGLRGDFSYRDHVRTDPVPAVWVVRSEDQPAAREILRDAGLLDSTRVATGYTLPVFRTEAATAADAPARKRAMRLKVGLLLVIAIVLVLAFAAQFAGRHTATPAVAPGARLPAGEAATPDTLARAVLSGELPTHAGQRVCLAVDGADPRPSLLAALPATPAQVLPASQCAHDATLQILSIHGYRPGKPTGTIVFDRRRGDRIVVSHQYDVRPDGAGWRVVEPYR